MKSPHLLSCKLVLSHLSHNFFFLLLPLSAFLLCHFVPLLLVLLLSFSLCVCVCASLWFLLPPLSRPLLGYIKPSGEPIVPRGPQLSALSLRYSSCSSPAFPRCRPNPLAANWKPERHVHISERQLRHRRRGGRLRQPVPHSAVLPVHRVALQQVGPRPPPWSRPGPVSISGQYPEGPKVRKKKKTFFFRLSSGLLMKPFVPLLFPLSLNLLRARFTKLNIIMQESINSS